MAPSGYDLGFQHGSVNSGAVVGFLLDHGRDVEAFVEEQELIGSVEITTGATISHAAYGLGAVRYRLRLRLATDVLKRDHRPGTETPATLRTRLLEFAAKTDGQVVLQLESGNRKVGFIEAVRFVGGPAVDGYIALLNLVDLGAA